MQKFSTAILATLLAATACNGANPDERDDDLRDPLLYEGSRFDEVRAAAFNAPYTELPQISVDAARFYRGGEDLFKKTVVDLFTNTHDHHPFHNKLLHPNGVCMMGSWEITEDTPYTGFFARGSRGLVVARASTAFSNTKRGAPRAFAMAIKIFPTTAGSVVVKPVNLFTFDYMFGGTRDHWTDAELSNEPAMGDVPGPSMMQVAQKVLWETMKTDSLARRPLYPLAQVGLLDPDSAVTPMKMTLRLDGSPAADDEDFRAELSHMIAAGPLRYALEVTGESRIPAQGPPVTTGTARKVGFLELTEAVASEGCDHRVRFHHVVNP